MVIPRLSKISIYLRILVALTVVFIVSLRYDNHFLSKVESCPRYHKLVDTSKHPPYAVY